MPKEKFLTNRQKEFAKFIVEGTYSNAECARKAGYSEGQAAKTASLLLNGKDFPLVVDHVKDLREAREKKYGVTLLGQLKRFSDLSKGAEESGQFSAWSMQRRLDLHLVVLRLIKEKQMLCIN